MRINVVVNAKGELKNQTAVIKRQNLFDKILVTDPLNAPFTDERHCEILLHFTAESHTSVFDRFERCRKHITPTHYRQYGLLRKNV